MSSQTEIPDTCGENAPCTGRPFTSEHKGPCGDCGEYGELGWAHVCRSCWVKGGGHQ